MITAKIVADSTYSVRLTTFVLTYPKFIHAEFMTHRAFSRNASSSRAIPVQKMIDDVKENPAMPLAFRKNQAGMQAGGLIDDQDRAVALWLDGRNRAVAIAEQMNAMGIHKQYVNRVLEPYAHITVVVTATDWANFFALRLHSMAQPEICELARCMWECYSTGKPELVLDGEWHLPFISPEDRLRAKYDTQEFQAQLLKQSVARCARVSYKNHDGTTSTIEQDLALYDRLVGSHPIHASPTEHQATPAANHKAYSGNLRGWIQYRKRLDNENITEFHGNTEPVGSL